MDSLFDAVPFSSPELGIYDVIPKDGRKGRGVRNIMISCQLVHLTKESQEARILFTPPHRVVTNRNSAGTTCSGANLLADFVVRCLRETAR